MILDGEGDQAVNQSNSPSNQIPYTVAKVSWLELLNPII